MKRENKFTDKYRKKLLSKVKEITEHIQLKMGYGVRVAVERDSVRGYVYRFTISLDDFKTHATIIIDSTNKATIMKDLKSQINHLDFKDEKRVSVSRKNISASSSIWCSSCDENKAAINFHRNTDAFLNRGGFTNICFSCANAQALEIYKDNPKSSIIYLCALYQRSFILNLCDRVLAMNLSPIEKMGEYFRMGCLQQYTRKRKNSFSSSDLFNDEVEHG